MGLEYEDKHIFNFKRLSHQVYFLLYSDSSSKYAIITCV